MSISAELMKKVFYPPEKVIEARAINLLLNSWVDLVDLPDIPGAVAPLVKLIELGYMNDATNRVKCRVEGTIADKEVENDILHTYLGSKPGIDDSIPLSAWFDKTMKVHFYSTAAISNFKARALYEVRNYTIADKIALGTTLTKAETALAAKYELHRKILSGELPMEYPKGPLVRQQVKNFYSASMTGAAAEQTIIDVYPPPGQKAVLTKLWCKRPSAYNSLTIKVYHDRKLYFEINPWALPDLASSESGTLQLIDRPIDLWIPGIKQVKVAMYCGVTETHVAAMAKIDLRKITIWDKLNWGLALTPEEKDLVTSLFLDEKLLAGLYVLAVPINLGGRGPIGD